jgi:WD40 repeat protein
MAKVVNLSVDQNADFSANINLTHANGAVWDLSDYTCSGKFKKHYESANSVTFTCAGYANGLITISLTDEDTTTLDHGKYVYDIIITNDTSGNITRVQEGILTLRPNIV